jgi:hypothetical protein
MHRARIAVLPALALALTACPRGMPGGELEGADVAETSDEYGTDSDSTGLLPDLPADTETTSGSETDSTDGGPNQGCCECVDGIESCWLAPEGNCEPGETLLEGCNVVDEALACGLDCGEPVEPWCCWCTDDLYCVPWEGEAECAAMGAGLGVPAELSECTGLPILDTLECDLACDPPPDAGYCCTCSPPGCYPAAETECFGDWYPEASCGLDAGGAFTCGGSC